MMVAVPRSSSTAAPAHTSQYFFWVDFLRGIAAVAVLVYHFNPFFYTQSGPQSPPVDAPFYPVLALFYEHGDSAVLLFWVISGFVFAGVYLDRASRVTAGEFFGHRLARLYPLHFVTLIAVALLQIFSMRALGHFQVYEYNDIYHFLLNLGFISAWGLEKGFSFNAPIWSVSVEVFIYLVFFLTIPLLSRRRGSELVLTILFGLLLALKTPEINFWLCGLCFYFGCCVFRIWQFLNARGAAWPLTAGLGCVAAVVLAGLLVKPLAQHVVAFQLILFPPVVLAFAALDRIDAAMVGYRVQVVGNLTYSLYLWHMPFQMLVLALLQVNGIGQMPAYPKAFFLTYVMVMFCIAWLSFRYLESPARRFVRRALL
jgi:peptidoglycan/LPS O-acetylase OafA/YrhL